MSSLNNRMLANNTRSFSPQRLRAMIPKSKATAANTMRKLWTISHLARFANI